MSPDTEQLYSIKEIGFWGGLTNALWFHLRQTYNLQLQNTSLVLYLKDNLRVFREANMHFGGLWEEVRIPGKKKTHTHAWGEHANSKQEVQIPDSNHRSQKCKADVLNSRPPSRRSNNNNNNTFY